MLRPKPSETISMTQAALSGVSTKLHAHLLPAGHRQKSTALILQPSPWIHALSQTKKTALASKIHKWEGEKDRKKTNLAHRGINGVKEEEKKKKKAKLCLHSVIICKWEQRDTYKGCWKRSVLSWAHKTRSGPVHMQMRSAPSRGKVRFSKASSSQHRRWWNSVERDAACSVCTS